MAAITICSDFGAQNIKHRLRWAGTLSVAESYPASEARDSGREELPHPRGLGSEREVQPHAQGVVAVRAQESLEEPSHIEGQEGGGKRYPSSKVRSSSCALLEQPCRDTPCPR